MLLQVETILKFAGNYSNLEIVGSPSIKERGSNPPQKVVKTLEMLANPEKLAI
jgi:hypothetical protein